MGLNPRLCVCTSGTIREYMNKNPMCVWCAFEIEQMDGFGMVCESLCGGSTTHIHIHSCAYVHHEIRALLSKYACEIQIRKNIQLLHYFELNFSNISALIHSLHCVGRLALMVAAHCLFKSEIKVSIV